MARRARAAAPAGRRQLKAVTADLAKGWPAGLTTLTGDDRYHLDAAERALIEALVPEEDREFALSVVGDDRVDVGQVVGMARSAGMFAPRRVVLVRYVEALDGEPDALLEYAKKPPPDSHLIVRAPALDQRRKLHKALGTAGRTIAFGLPDDPRSWITEMNALAAERDLQLDPEAAALLAQLATGDLYRAAGELDKLALVDEGKPVDLEALRVMAAGSAALSGWELADAVLDRDHAKALAAARRLVEEGDEPIRILGGLAWRGRVMLQARAMMDRGVPPQRIVQTTRAWGIRDRLLDGVRRYELAELLAFPSHLLAADRTLKSRRTPPPVVLEELVDRLVGKEGC